MNRLRPGSLKLREILYPGIIIYVLVSLVLLGGMTVNSVRQHLYEQKIAAVQEAAFLLKNIVPDLPDEDTQAAVTQLAINTSYRITVIDASGSVLADSSSPPNRMDNHLSREEVSKALAGEPYSAIRYSDTLGYDMIYFAVPLDSSTVLRTALPFKELDESLRNIYLYFSIGGGLFLLIALGITYLLIAKIERPLTHLARQSSQLARLNFSGIAPVPSSIREVQVVSDSLRIMAQNMRKQFESIRHQRDEFKAVLDSMTEAVIVIDEHRNIVEANPSAVAYFSPSGTPITGLSLHTVIKSDELRETIYETIKDGIMRSSNISLKKYHYHVNVTTLPDVAGSIQIVLVCNDITALMHLERIRRDFVANVSHELKTPVTSIQGFSETLLDGALEDPDAAKRFVAIIKRQTERLQSIIDDLLILSELEQNQSRKHFSSLVQLKPVIDDSLLICREKNQQFQREIQITCGEALQVKGNAHLIEQALINLIDNAMKYSEYSSPIKITCSAAPEEVTVTVSDQGYGIPKKDLNRIFERFYRVEKARSRDKGGTGLGLSIVKHIILQHQGTVDVESSEGKGTSFTLHFPN